jgi:dUTP pyrophosphatase
MQIETVRLPHCCKLPEYKTRGAAGMDIYAPLRVVAGAVMSRKGSSSLVIEPGEAKTFACGFAVAIPEGFVGLVAPRSGLAARYSVTVGNAPGVIDSDYRGEVKVILRNEGRRAFFVRPGDRIAQLIIMPTPWCSLVQVDRLPETERGSGSLGSTGR